MRSIDYCVSFIFSDYLKNNPSTKEINNMKLKARREAYLVGKAL